VRSDNRPVDYLYFYVVLATVALVIPLIIALIVRRRRLRGQAVAAHGKGASEQAQQKGVTEYAAP
jgi:hypothetical protein